MGVDSPGVDVTFARKQGLVLFGAVCLLDFYIGVGAALGEAADDRAAGPWLLAVVAVAVIAAAAVRFRVGPMVRVAGGVALLQAALGALMLLRGIGSAPIVGFIHGLLVVGWIGCAWLFARASTSEGDAAGR